jgi:DNA-binding beta-propeller fold protein YncE
MAKNPDDRFPTAGELGRAALHAAPASSTGAHAEADAAVTRAAALAKTRELGKPRLGSGVASAPRSRRLLLAGAAAGLAALAGVAALLLGAGDSNDGDRVDSAAPSTAAGRVVGAPLPVGDSPSAVSAGTGSVWVANTREETVSRIDPKSRRAVGPPIAVGEDPVAVAVGAGSVWVANFGDGTVTRIDPRSNRPVGRPIAVGRGPTDLVVGRGRVWVATEVDGIVTLDARTGQPRGTPIRVRSAGSLALAGDILWVADQLDGTLRAVHTKTRAILVDQIPIGDSPMDLAAGPNELWVSVAGEGALKRVAFGSGGRDVRTIRIGGRPEFLALRQGVLWVTDRDAEAVVRLDVGSGATVGDPIRVGEDPAGVAVAADRVWVSSAVKDSVTIVDPR